ncbi:malonic semialdehyde reductase [Xanthobacter albus]|uniref:malonic semialdehyde reductase n=1 Tax=Xanthobacter albus TaxID=3119929 RepID=UPI00372D0A5C
MGRRISVFAIQALATEEQQVVSPNETDVLDRLFLKARTYNDWLPRAVPLNLLRKIYEVARMGPTSMNSSPLRLVFVTSPQAKTKLIETLSPGNRRKTENAPVTVIFARDTRFFEQLGRLFPHANVRPLFEADAALAEETARRNVALQAAYFMLAARAEGLDCGPMSGFDRAALDAAFFPDGSWRCDFLCNLGYGAPSSLYERLPRLDFAEAAQVV